MPWSDAIDQPGAAQMQHARALLESRPFLTRVPDDDVRRHGSGPDEHAGSRALPLRRDARCERQLRDGLRAGRPAVHGAHEQDHGIRGSTAWWFNPRTGKATAIGTFPNTGDRTFTPPDPGEIDGSTLDGCSTTGCVAESYEPQRQRQKPTIDGIDIRRYIK